MEERNETLDRMKYFFFGGIIGALAAILFAPKSGRETREMIASKTKETRKSVEEGIKAAREGLIGTKEKVESEAKELLEKAKNITMKEKELLSAAIEAGKQAYKEEKESASKS